MMPNYWVLRVTVWAMRFLGYGVWFDVRYVQHGKIEHYGAKTHPKAYTTLDDAWREYVRRDGVGLRPKFTVDLRMYVLLHSKRPTFLGQELLPGAVIPFKPGDPEPTSERVVFDKTYNSAEVLRRGHRWTARAAGVATTPGETSEQQSTEAAQHPQA